MSQVVVVEELALARTNTIRKTRLTHLLGMRMRNPLTSATLMLTAVVLSANVSAQFPQGTQPSPEQMRAMQEQMMKMMKPAIEEAFDNSDVDDSDSLDKDEMVEFSVELVKAQVKLYSERGMQVREPSEDELSELRELAKQELDEGFKDADTDDSGGVTQEELLKAMFADAFSEEEEDSESSLENEDENGSDDSKESSSGAS